MRELLTRTGDYGCLAADVHVPGRPSRHARAIYLAAPAALPVVNRARDALGPLGGRVEIRLLPESAALGTAQRAQRSTVQRSTVGRSRVQGPTVQRSGAP